MQNNVTKKIENIPVRQPDGSFIMVEVGGEETHSNVISPSGGFPTGRQLSQEPTQLVSLKLNKPKPVSVPKPPMQNNNTGIDWQSAVNKVWQSLDLELFDEVAESRLKSVIMSRLRDVRDVLATKETLTKDRSAGGLGLSEMDANNVIAAIDSEYKIIHSHPNNQPATSINLKSHIVDDPFDLKAEINALVESELPIVDSNEYMNMIASFLDKDHHSTLMKTESTAVLPKKVVYQLPKNDVIVKTSKLVGQPFQSLTLKTKPQSEPPAIKLTKDIKSDIKPKFVLDESLIPKDKTGTGIKQNIIKPTEFIKPKPTMNDVVAEKRLMGPMDELRSMRLVDFRRLGTSTSERLQKVKNHIEELEEESFAKKVEAIQAWRSNPIYRMYVQIGSQSLMGTQTVADVIKEKQEKGEEVLTQDEFEQLTDFNKKLKY